MYAPRALNNARVNRVPASPKSNPMGGVLVIVRRMEMLLVACMILALLYCAPRLAFGQARGGVTMETVLKQLDEGSHNFRGLSADVERTKVTVVVNDKSTDAGT